MSSQNVFEMILDTGKQGDPVSASLSAVSPHPGWNESEGQLAIDVAETETDLFVISTIAGAVADKIEVYVHNDLLTIRGQRSSPLDGLSFPASYFYQECFWGCFSRTIVLPVDVRGESATAEYRGGVLIVKIPKERRDARVPITVVEE